MGIIKGGQIIGGSLAPSRIIPWSPGAPAAIDPDYFVAATAMKVGDYTPLETSMPDGIARNVTVKHTAGDTVDTLGTVTVTGTDMYGSAISEEITPSNGTTVEGAKAFLTISGIEGAGWVVDGSEATADTIDVGYGDKLGLPVCLSRNTVLRAFLNGALEGTDPTVAVDASDVSKNTVKLHSATDGNTVIVDYYES